MNSDEIIKAIVDSGVLAVIRANSVDEAVKMATYAAKGGIKGLEITFTVPDADKVIEKLVESNVDAVVGAGTVLNEETAKLAYSKGAKFIVSPCFDDAVNEFCKSVDIPYFSGCFTPTEIYNAMKKGVKVIKVFPGSVCKPSYFKDVHGPFPKAKLLPSGGVSLENINDWIKFGAVAVSAGSSLTAPAKTGEYEKIVDNAKAFVEEVKKARAQYSK
jgi:2-dehydro-3-deoxyphosphogluconate aldolase / (4S)-4-hydroxy-2-oxoglutarate aldolase